MACRPQFLKCPFVTRVVGLVVVAALLGAGMPLANAAMYAFTDLGVATGGVSSSAIGINAAGQVVGNTTMVGGTTVATSWVWNGPTPAGLNPLPAPPMAIAHDCSRGYAINGSGQMVGLSTRADGTVGRGVVWNTWGDPAPTLLTTSAYSIATGINDAGTMVGYSTFPTSQQATIWTNGGATQTALNVLTGGASDYAYSINNSGQVSGYSYKNGVSEQYAVIWNGTTPTQLGMVGGFNYSMGYALNSSAQVTGFVSTTGDASQHAVIWNGTTPTDLGTLGGAISQGMAISDAGQVVGLSRIADNSQHAFIMLGSTMTDLNTLVDASLGTWTLVDARGINASGLIVGAATNSVDGAIHAYVLTPLAEVPEPGTLVLAALGLMGFVTRRRRK